MLCVNVQASNFTDADPADNLWGTAGNWSAGVPTAAVNPHIISGSPGVLIPNGYTAYGSNIFMSVGGWPSPAESSVMTVEAGGALEVYGLNLGAGGGVPVDATVHNNGDITATGGFSLGYQSSGCVGVFNQNAGTATTDGHFILGNVVGATGTLNLNDGIVTNGQMFVMGNTGAGSVGNLEMIGGTLNSNQWLQVGYRGTGTANISGGTINTGSGFGARIGEGGIGLVNMTGGVFNAGDFSIGTFAGGTGHLQLDGGTINASLFSFGGGTGTMDFNGNGQLIISGDVSGLIQGYVGSGLITSGLGSIGDVTIDLAMNPGSTTVYAVPEPATMILLGLGGMLIRKRR